MAAIFKYFIYPFLFACAIGVAFIVVSVLYGDRPFLSAGDRLRDVAYKIGAGADSIKGFVASAKNAASRIGHSIGSGGKRLRETTGRAVDGVKSTGASVKEKAAGLANSAAGKDD